MDIPLSEHKILFPAVRPRTVRRPRLFSRLDGLLTRKLATICAPAGHGKTTLASDWLDHLAQRRDIAVPHVAWLTLDAQDNAPDRFCRALLAALGRVYPGAGDALRPLIQPQAQTWIEPLIVRLLNQIATSPIQCCLALDDHHCLENPRVHETVDFFLDHMPPQLHLLICSRTRPPLALGRLRAFDQIIEIDGAQLVMTAAEAATMLSETLGIDLTPPQRHRLLDKTKGWPAGIQLAGMALRDRDAESRDRVIDAVAELPHIADYLQTEAYSDMHPNVRLFLLRTSLLDRVCGPLCSAILSDDGLDGAALLETVARDVLFLTPRDAAGHWYGYHQLYREMLQTTVQRDHPEMVRETLLAASDWYAQNGDLEQAVGLALDAGETDLAAERIEAMGYHLVEGGLDAQVLAWMDRIPADATSGCPWLQLAQVFALCHAERYTGLLTRLEALESDAPRFPDVPVAACLALVRAWLAMRRETAPSRMVTFGRQAKALLAGFPRDKACSHLESRAEAHIGHGLFALGEVASAEQAFGRMVHQSQEAGSLSGTLRAMLEQALFYQAVGPLARCAEICRRGIDLAAQAHGQPVPLAELAMLEGLLGLMHLLWDDLDQSLAHAQRAVTLFSQSSVQPGHYVEHGLLNLFWSHCALKDAPGAYAVFCEMIDILSACHETVRWQLDPKLVRARIVLALWRGAWRPLLYGVQRWVESAGLDVRDADALRARDHEAMGADLMALGDPAGAQKWLKAGAQRYGNWILTRTLFTIWQAVDQEMLGNSHKAEWLMIDALRLAQPEGIRQPFLEHGPWAHSIFRRLEATLGRRRCDAPDLPTVGYVRQILSRFPDDLPNTPTSKPVPVTLSRTLIEPLTPREMEVLERLARGLPNHQIADELYVTGNTVAYHLKNIYGKLDTHTRTGAVRVARELGVLA